MGENQKDGRKDCHHPLRSKNMNYYKDWYTLNLDCLWRNLQRSSSSSSTVSSSVYYFCYLIALRPFYSIQFFSLTFRHSRALHPRLPQSSSSSLSFSCLHSFICLFFILLLLIFSLIVLLLLLIPFLSPLVIHVGDATGSTLLRLWYESILPNSQLPCQLWGQILFEWVQLSSLLLHWTR